MVIGGWRCTRVICGLMVVEVDQVLAMRRSTGRPAGHSGRMLRWASFSEEGGLSTTSCDSCRCVVVSAMCCRVADGYGGLAELRRKPPWL